MMGDFNFPNIDWNIPRVRGLDGEVFVRCVQEGFLTQHVDKPTRGEAVLDLILANEPGQVSISQWESILGIAIITLSPLC